MTLTELLARIEELDKKATKGKWSLSSSFFDGALYSKGGEEEVAANADLIAQYRSACPKLAKIVHKLIEQRDYYICDLSYYDDDTDEEFCLLKCNQELEKILEET